MISFTMVIAKIITYNIEGSAQRISKWKVLDQAAKD